MLAWVSHCTKQERISELEKQLKDAELTAIAFSTMVDIHILSAVGDCSSFKEKC